MIAETGNHGKTQMATRRESFYKINKTNRLPTPSRTALELMQLCHDETTSLNDIAQVIQTDPALSAELLKYANAAFLATGIQVASVQKATVKLGMQTVVNLALGFSLLSHNKRGKCKGFDYEKFWSTSLFQAIAAKTIASLGKEFDQEELFICALLSHMGELALACLFPQEYADIIAEDPSILIRKTLEKDEFQIDSSELTVELFLDWGLPAHYALAAGFHNDFDYAELGTGTTRNIAEILNFSRQIAELCQQSKPGREQLVTIEKAVSKFSAGKRKFGLIFDAIISQWQEWGGIFNIRTQQCPHYDEIMGEQKIKT
jgi:two-component system, cell cycle response regulator